MFKENRYLSMFKQIIFKLCIDYIAKILIKIYFSYSFLLLQVCFDQCHNFVQLNETLHMFRTLNS